VVVGADVGAGEGVDKTVVVGLSTGVAALSARPTVGARTRARIVAPVCMNPTPPSPSEAVTLQ
jgi:hypothetical protein